MEDSLIFGKCKTTLFLFIMEVDIDLLENWIQNPFCLGHSGNAEALNCQISSPSSSTSSSYVCQNLNC